jgi:glutamate synthase (NADPH/NADH) small chain
VAFDDLRRRFDAVVIATGVYKARALDLPGIQNAPVVQALDYLIASNRKGLGDAVPAFDDGRLDAKGKRVVVVGGGDTAMDCVRTAIRQGATAVTCLYRRDRANMPGSAREVDHAVEEGVAFDWLAQPERVLAGPDGVEVRVRRMRLGAPDASGRQTPEPDDAAPASLAAELVIAALGFEAENLATLFGCADLPLTPAGTVAADPESQATALPGVYAVGDIVRGASLVVWAIRDGRAAAHAILHAFSQPRATVGANRAERAGAAA